MSEKRSQRALRNLVTNPAMESRICQGEFTPAPVAFYQYFFIIFIPRQELFDLHFTGKFDRGVNYR